MIKSFLAYFFHYLFFAKTRQRLLFLAFAGLFLASFSLVSIQGIMKGLQSGLIQRSKLYHGNGYFNLHHLDEKKVFLIEERLKQLNIPFTKEWEVEVLLRQGNQVMPTILHGVDFKFFKPTYLDEKNLDGIILGGDLSYQLRANFFDSLQVITPQNTASLLGEVPRLAGIEKSDVVLSDVQDIDSFHSWVRLSFLQNLFRKNYFNRFRLYLPPDQELPAIIQDHPDFVSWERQNATLVWSLKLETKVMFTLFLSMSFLISFAISAGLLLFLEKIRIDLASFWILGAEEKKLTRSTFTFVSLISLLSSLMGVVLGVCALLVLEKFGHHLMPDIFVERGFPIKVTLLSLLVSIFLPFMIAFIFTYLTFRQFNREQTNFLELIRRSG